MPGTGLPIQRRDPTFLEAPRSYTPDPSAAIQAGAALARFGDRLGNIADQLQAATDARAVADIEIKARERAIELAAQFPDDPEGFKNAYSGFEDGTLGGVDLRYADVARQALAKARLSVYDNVLAAAAAKGKRLTADSIKARLEAADLDALGAAGKGDGAGVAAALDDSRRFLEAGVAAGLWSPDHAVVELAKRRSAAQGEAFVAGVTGTFWSAGADAAKRLVDSLSGTGFAERVAGAENATGKPDAANPNSSAVGDGQFLAGTWLELMRRHMPERVAGMGDADVLALRKVPSLSRKMIDVYAQENRQFLAGKGLPTDDGALSLAHFVGPGGAEAVLKAAPNTPVEQVLSADAIKANPFLKGKTTGDVRQWATDRISSGGRNGLALTPSETERLRARAEAKLKDLEEQAGAVVMTWAEAIDPMQAYGQLSAGTAGREAMAAYGVMSPAGRIAVRQKLLTLSASVGAAEDRAERAELQRRTRATNEALFDLYSLNPSDPQFDQKRTELVGRVRALGTVPPETFGRIMEQGRNAGPDNPELLFDLEDRIERGVIGGADALVPFIGRGLSYDTARRLTGKINQAGDERYKLGLSRIRAAAGLVEGGLFQASSAEAKAASRMRIAFDDAMDAARSKGDPFDPVEIAKGVIIADQNARTQRGADPLIQSYRREIEAAAEKVRAADLRDADGNRIAIEFDGEDDIEAARRLSDPNSGVLGLFKRGLFTETELRRLRTAIQKTNEVR